VPTLIRGRRGWLGSLLLAVVIALVLLNGGGDGGRDGGSGREGGPTPRGSSTEAEVVRVIDGDTIVVSIDGRDDDVRYIGIDTPETVKPGTPVQCFGPAAHDFNERLVDGRRVRLVFDRERRDVYGRLLAYVYTGGRFVNAELARRGYARTLTIAPNTAHAGLFHRLADAAGRAGRGLWGACD
jgi:micrococcal nuclease